MTDLPNPWISNSATDLAESAAGPCLTDPTDPAAALIPETAQSSPPAASPATDVDFPSASVAPNSSSCGGVENSATSDNAKRQERVAGLEAQSATIERRGSATGPHDLSSDTQNIIEYFSDYAHRRCMDKVSPPLKREPREFKPDFNALAAALDIHPRDLDLDPAPLFLRKPRKAFMEAIFRAGGLR